MDRVPIKPQRPVGKRSIADFVHVVDKRLVCKGCERVRMGRVLPINALARYQRSPGGCCGIFKDKRVPLNSQMSANEQRWPKHDFYTTTEGVGWTKGLL